MRNPRREKELRKILADLEKEPREPRRKAKAHRASMPDVLMPATSELDSSAGDPREDVEAASTQPPKMIVKKAEPALAREESREAGGRPESLAGFTPMEILSMWETGQLTPQERQWVESRKNLNLSRLLVRNSWMT